MASKVAIVGAGVSGLTTLKQCLEEGFDATVFEARSTLGGQWRYEEPDPATNETASSVYDGVLLNSCRDTTAFSDFPIDPARYPDYFGHRRFLNYIEEYADHFDLRRHIQLNTRVASCKQDADGKWIVKTEENGWEVAPKTFDAVFACSGSLSKPMIPSFPGLKTFRGKVLHSRTYRRPTGLVGKRIAIIGFGNSAADLSSELSWQAKELHLITRRGGWIVPRYALGKPAEAYDNRFSETLLPARLAQWGQMKFCNFVMGELPDVLKPDHGLMQANITMRSDLLENIKTGRIIAHRAEVQELTETSLVLTNGIHLDVDIIICCTGYHIDVPYVPKKGYRREFNPIPTSNNSMDLYKLVASPNFKNLFFIGFVELPGPLLPVAEAQARWATAVLAHRIRLPSIDAMNKSINSFQQNIIKTMVVSDRHTVSIRYLPYCDDLLKDVNAAPSFWKLLFKLFTSNPFKAIRVMSMVYFGINSPAQYRLFGRGSTPGLAYATLLRLAREGKELSSDEQDALETTRVRQRIVVGPDPYGRD